LKLVIECLTGAFSLTCTKSGDFDNCAVCRNKKDFSSVAFNVLFPCDDNLIREASENHTIIVSLNNVTVSNTYFYENGNNKKDIPKKQLLKTRE
jgi:hypothetical protein